MLCNGRWPGGPEDEPGVVVGVVTVGDGGRTGAAACPNVPKPRARSQTMVVCRADVDLVCARLDSI